MEPKTPQEAQVAYDVGYDQGYNDALAISKRPNQNDYNRGWVDGVNAYIAKQGYTPLAGG